MILKNNTFILFILFIFKLHSQDYLEKITIQTCDCVNKVSDTINTEKFTMELGLCMISASEPYKKQLKKDYGINLNNITGEDGEALGKLIGIKMTTVCPAGLMKLYGKTKTANEEKEDIKTFESIGKITSIDRENFVVFSVFDNSGKSLKFYWLSSVESNVDLANNYKTFLEVTVKIKYIQKEFFDPKIGEYRNFNVIEKIEKVFK